MHLSPEDQKKLVARLKRAEGQLAGVRRMVEGDGYCVDVLLQLQAVRGALAKIGQLVLRNHVETCVSDALQDGNPDQVGQKLDELMDVFGRYAGVASR